MNIEDYSKYYIQGSDHYLIPKNEFIELFNEMSSWKEESKKQKEVIDKLNNEIDLALGLIKHQPTEDDTWILNRLRAFKYILKKASE